MDKPYLSIVIPLYNEADNIAELSLQISNVMAKTGKNYELLLVDDGSKDATYERICALQEKDKRITAIRLGKNYGQSIALAAGVDHSEGEIVIFMDGDLQHDPAEIPLFRFKKTENAEAFVVRVENKGGRQALTACAL